MKYRIYLFFTILFLLSVSYLNGQNRMCELEKDASGRWLMGIPDSLLNRDLLFGARVISLSKADKSISAGQMRYNPVVMQFVEANNEIVFNTINVSDIAEDGSPIKESLKRNTRDAISLNIPVIKRDNSLRWIELSAVFQNPFPLVFPIASKNKTSVVQQHSGVFDVKAFERNLEIKVTYQYKCSEPFATDIQYSIVLLPDIPMNVRLSDPRVGFSNVKKRVYADKKAVRSVQFISRWRIQPKPKDVEAHRRGELVEPEQSILIHIDSGVPKDWRPYVRQGIEDWNLAFEAIGFKNVIRTKDYTHDLDSEDSRNVCFRFLPLDFANANGALWNDPRTGEILQGDILFWQNVVDLIQSWRFAQTAAVDPKARPANLDNETMGEMIRYAVAHEMGHLLGLQHNMRSSYAYPVDSLRSASFTQKYGTTASIMDYARFNYVAQPGDLEKGVRLLPPILGPFDYLSIKYAYEIVYDTLNEKEILNNMFVKVENDPMYLFSPMSISIIAADPASQSDAIGNDLVYSAELGIQNIKLIVRNLSKWTLFPDGDSERMKKMFDAVCKHYFRLLSLSISNIGGIHSYPMIDGKMQKPLEYFPLKKQKETLKFISEQLWDANKLLETSDIINYLGSQSNIIENGQKEILDKLFSTIILLRLMEQESANPTPYLASNYLSDACNYFFHSKTNNSIYHQAIQLYVVEKLKQISETVRMKREKQTPFEVLASSYAQAELEKLKLSLKNSKSQRSLMLISAINNCKKRECSFGTNIENDKLSDEDTKNDEED